MNAIVRRIGTAGGMAILTAGLLLGNNARAGQSEWATAGKILAGVLTADVLFNHIPVTVSSQPTVVYETQVVHDYCPPPPTVVYETRVVREYYPPPPVIIYEQNYRYNGGGFRHGGWNRQPAHPVIYRQIPYRREGSPAIRQEQPFHGQPRANVGTQHIRMW